MTLHLPGMLAIPGSKTSPVSMAHLRWFHQRLLHGNFCIVQASDALPWLWIGPLKASRNHQKLICHWVWWCWNPGREVQKSELQGISSHLPNGAIGALTNCFTLLLILSGPGRLWQKPKHKKTSYKGPSTPKICPSQAKKNQMRHFPTRKCSRRG
jgi:hypothetical protein